MLSEVKHRAGIHRKALHSTKRFFPAVRMTWLTDEKATQCIIKRRRRALAHIEAHRNPQPPTPIPRAESALGRADESDRAPDARALGTQNPLVFQAACRTDESAALKVDYRSMILLYDDIRVYMCGNMLNWRTGISQVRKFFRL